MEVECESGTLKVTAGGFAQADLGGNYGDFQTMLCEKFWLLLAPLSHLVSQQDLRQPILVSRVGVLQVRVGLLKFRLAELHD